MLNLSLRPVKHLQQTISAKVLAAEMWETDSNRERWLDEMLSKGEFVENTDYVLANNDVFMTPTMAKHFAMMSYTPKGAEIRDYFIALEKKPLVARDPKTQALIESLLRLDELEHAQKTQAAEIAQTKETLRELEHRVNVQTEFFSILAWANLQNRSLPYSLAVEYGKQAAKLSREQGMAIGSVPDPRFGQVGAYHKDILTFIMGSIG